MNFFQKLHTQGFIFKYYLTTFFSGLMFYLSVLVPFYTEFGHISLTQVQILQSWLMIWMFIWNIPTGAIADHIGRKYSVSLGNLLLAISCIVYLISPGFYTFLIAEFLAAVGTSFVIGASSSLVYDYLKNNGKENESKHVLGRSSSLNNLGTVVAAPVGSFIASRFGIQVPMLVSALPLVLASVIILTIEEPRTKKTTSVNKILQTGKEGVTFLFKNRPLQYLVANDTLVWIGAYFLVWLYQPMLLKVGLAIVYFGFIRSAFSLAGMAATVHIRTTERLFGSEKTFINLTAVIVSLSLLLVAVYPSTITVILAILLIGGFASARTSVLNTLMNEYIPAEKRATVLSVSSTINMIVFALANPAVGYIADHSLRLAFLGVGLLPLLAFSVLHYQTKSVAADMETLAKAG